MTLMSLLTRSVARAVRFAFRLSWHQGRSYLQGLDSCQRLIRKGKSRMRECMSHCLQASLKSLVAGPALELERDAFLNSCMLPSSLVCSAAPCVAAAWGPLIRSPSTSMLGSDDDFGGMLAAAAQDPEAAPKKGAKRKRAPGARGTGVEDTKTCFAGSCELMKLSGKRWCAKHNRLYDNLWTQAKKHGETAALQQAVSTPSKAQETLDEFEEENPADSRYARKNLIQWSVFKRKHEVKKVFRSRQGCRPYEYKQWVRRCETEMAWSTADAKAQWQNWLASDCDRDDLGLNGAARLLIPTIEERHRDDDRSVANQYEESGKNEKEIDRDHREVLLKQLHAPMPSADGFILSDAKIDDAEMEDEFHTPQKKPQKEVEMSPPPVELKPEARGKRVPNVVSPHRSV